MKETIPLGFIQTATRQCGVRGRDPLSSNRLAARTSKDSSILEPGRAYPVLGLLRCEALVKQLVDQSGTREGSVCQLPLGLFGCLVVPVDCHAVRSPGRIRGRILLVFQLRDQTGARERGVIQVAVSSPQSVLLADRPPLGSSFSLSSSLCHPPARKRIPLRASRSFACAVDDGVELEAFALCFSAIFFAKPPMWRAGSNPSGSFTRIYSLLEATGRAFRSVQVSFRNMPRQRPGGGGRCPSPG